MMRLSPSMIPISLGLIETGVGRRLIFHPDIAGASTPPGWWFAFRWHAIKWCIATLALLASGCHANTEGRLHPTEESLRIPGLQSEWIEKRTLSSSGSRTVGNDEAAFARIASGFSNAIRTGAVGSSEADSLSFGSIADVALDWHRGRILVLDGRSNQVVVLDTTMRIVDRFSRSGSGPGELRMPRALGVTQAGTVVVADRGRMIKLFSDAGEGYVEKSKIVTSFNPEDICIGDSSAYARGWEATQNAVIHEYLLTDGGLLRSIGSGYRDPSPFVQEQMSDGYVACASDGAWIAGAYQYLPVVVIHDGGGKPVKLLRIRDFHPRKIVETTNESGRPRIVYRSDGSYSVISGLFTVSEELFGVQVAQVNSGGPDSRPHFDTYLVSARTGTAIYLEAIADGQQIAGVMGPFLATFSNDPFPQAALWRMSIANDNNSISNGIEPKVSPVKK